MNKVFSIIVLLISLTSFAQQKNVFDIARNGNVGEIKALMKINPDTINTVNHMGFTPLILACYSGNEEVGTFLINNVNNIDYLSPEGTALSALSYKYNKNLVEEILKKGADPNIKDAQGNTSIFWAVKTQNVELVEKLLVYGAKTKIKDHTERSLFDYAIETRNSKIINLLKNE